MDNLGGTWISHIIMAHSYEWYVHIFGSPYLPKWCLWQIYTWCTQMHRNSNTYPLHMYLNVWSIVLPLKSSIHDVNTCGTLRCCINIANTYGKRLWIIHIHMVHIFQKCIWCIWCICNIWYVWYIWYLWYVLYILCLYKLFFWPYLQMVHISMELGSTSK
jgi:hypothetical protein